MSSLNSISGTQEQFQKKSREILPVDGIETILLTQADVDALLIKARGDIPDFSDLANLNTFSKKII